LGQWRIRLIENGTVVEVVADLERAAVRPAMVASRADVTAACWPIIERLEVWEAGVAVGDQNSMGSEDIRTDSVVSNDSLGHMNIRQLCYPHKVSRSGG
jgi:hypothetical protein